MSKELVMPKELAMSKELAELSRRDAVMLAGAAALAAVSAGTSEARAETMSIKPASDDVFIVVDVQNDFLPGGALAVKNGDQVIAPINALARKFVNVVQTQDWHTKGHISFASAHSGTKAFETTQLPYGTQVLWPDHCVQGSAGAAFSDKLDLPMVQLVIRKGYHPNVDSYSAFLEADKTTKTGLAGYLGERGIKRCFVAGLATDFCVGWTAMDAVKAGFETFVIEDASRGIDTMGSLAAAIRGMDAAGVKRIQAAAILT
ncbi:nicotinamidase/pyrazinamidase [Rhizobiales bacterium GAS191]|nr:nicotinamidase/pyrazinamidase [Rhizobiales bacterium GAS113]SEE89648.1 nicotinamidase/pyrazinamidase [Rhizobiales bacterium GAS191]